MGKNSDDFIAYLENEVKNHSIYVWGAQGQTKPTITSEWIKSRETTAKNADRAIAFWQKQVKAGYGDVLRAFDCSGLGMYWLYNKKGLLNKDMSANTMMSTCVKLKRENIKRGDWVFCVNGSGVATHIGYVVDDELNVIEAKGRDDGVVKRALNASGTSYWNAYGRPECLMEQEQEQSEALDIPFIGVVNGSSLNVRSGRGSSFEKLCVAYNKESRTDLLMLSNLKDGWYQVCLMPKEKGYEPVCGYVSANYIRRKEAV